MTRSILSPLTVAASIVYSLSALPASALVVDPRVGTSAAASAAHPPSVQTPQQIQRKQAGPKVVPDSRHRPKPEKKEVDADSERRRPPGCACGAQRASRGHTRAGPRPAGQAQPPLGAGNPGRRARDSLRRRDAARRKGPQPPAPEPEAGRLGWNSHCWPRGFRISDRVPRICDPRGILTAQASLPRRIPEVPFITKHHDPTPIPPLPAGHAWGVFA